MTLCDKLCQNNEIGRIDLLCFNRVVTFFYSLKIMYQVTEIYVKKIARIFWFYNFPIIFHIDDI